MRVLRECVFLCVCVGVYAGVNVYVCMCMCVCVHAHTSAFMHTYVCYMQREIGNRQQDVIIRVAAQLFGET